MPILKNAKHERFAQARASGLTVDAAYAEAGYKPHRSNASRLSANDNISARVDEILNAGAERAGIDAGQIFTESARIALSDIRSLFDNSGNLKPVHELDDDTARAIKKIKVTTKPGNQDDGNPIHVTEIEFWPKMDAIGKLGQHFKLFGEGETGNDPLKRFAELLFRAAARPMPLAEPTTPAMTAQVQIDNATRSPRPTVRTAQDQRVNEVEP